ncbi:hypothetical protein EC968_010447, partial [Mortierella alpina]
EREQSLREMAEIGRLPHESWKVFAQRVQKKVTTFQVQGDTVYLVNHLLSSLPSELRNIIRSANGMKDPTTVSSFCDILSQCLGPDNLPTNPAGRNNGKAPTSNNRSGSRNIQLTRCDICNAMTNHTTEQHVTCTICGKLGHHSTGCNKYGDHNPLSNTRNNNEQRNGNNRHNPYRQNGSGNNRFNNSNRSNNNNWSRNGNNNNWSRNDNSTNGNNFNNGNNSDNGHNANQGAGNSGTDNGQNNSS